MTKKYTEMSRDELKLEYSSINEQYQRYKNMKLSLDLSRGKPGADQLDLLQGMLDCINSSADCRTENGFDCRNYGGLDGLSEMKKLFAEVLGVSPEQVIAGGNSSLNMMFDTIAQAMTHGMGDKPWYECKERKFLCPVPGYDRHFAITEYFGFKLIPIATTADGPDMDAVEEWVKDETVKGIWCVPKYTNPDGTTYSDETVKRMSALKPAAKDFRIFWDNAYVVHHLYETHDQLLNIYTECVKQCNPDLPIIFTSSSKITFPGAGVAVQAASPNNVAMFKERMQYQTIGPDKLNQLRHSRLLHTMKDVEIHMEKLAGKLRPKFDAVLAELDSKLEGLGIAEWRKPNGGYFISLYVLEGCATRVVELCANAGMTLTPAGATYPYGVDPQDSMIRIAPSLPPVEELEKAMHVFCTSLRLAALEKYLGEEA